MAEQSNQVSVLAVLDDLRKGLAANAISMPELDEARAAVAELVEAVKEKLAADDAHFGGERSHATARRVDAADARLRAALARVQGGA